MSRGGITVKKRSVNDEDLFNAINNEVYSVVMLLGSDWPNEAKRKQFIETIEEYLEDVIETGVITQAKVVCNKSNNPTFSAHAKKYVLEVHYRQLHCLNTTKIEYHIQNRNARG